MIKAIKAYLKGKAEAESIRQWGRVRYAGRGSLAYWLNYFDNLDRRKGAK